MKIINKIALVFTIIILFYIFYINFKFAKENGDTIETFDKIPSTNANGNFDLVSLLDFTKQAIKGEPGDLGLQF